MMAGRVSLARRTDARHPMLLLDVREPGEHALDAIDGDRLVPLGQLANRLEELPRDRPIITYCATGVRSSVTYFALRQLGYEDVGVFTGSFVEWSSDPARPVTTGEKP